jgi:hypothetical protein
MRKLALALIVFAGCSPGKTPSAPSPAEGGLTISGPFVHEHLAVYVVENPEAKSRGEFITLEEGMKSGAVKVTEKKDAQVSELLIENASDQPCFVQAGDVVKGGQQDRVIASDFVIPARSGPKPLASFCVESGRWSGEAVFAVTAGQAPAKDLKLAVQAEKNQGKVWEEVAKAKAGIVTQERLQASRSTSLNEELENQKVRDRRDAFRAALGKVIDGKPHAVGLVSAVNGTISTADVYADPGLFRKLFPKLLDSAALEAISKAPKATPAPPASEVAAFLAKGSEGRTQQEKTGEGLEAVRTENQRTVRFKYLYNKSELHCQTLMH